VTILDLASLGFPGNMVFESLITLLRVRRRSTWDLFSKHSVVRHRTHAKVAVAVAVAVVAVAVLVLVLVLVVIISIAKYGYLLVPHVLQKKK